MTVSKIFAREEIVSFTMRGTGIKYAGVSAAARGADVTSKSLYTERQVLLSLRNDSLRLESCNNCFSTELFL